MIEHPFEALYNSDSKILILGSFPSVKSREENFFYGHPQNRFWKVTSSLLSEPVPLTIPDKRKFLLKNNIALWDVIKSCEIENSSDSSIRNVTPNDLSIILQNSNIKMIFTNGKTADKYYRKFQLKKTNTEALCLPSTSPANAAFGMERLLKEWSIILKYLNSTDR